MTHDPARQLLRRRSLVYLLLSLAAFVSIFPFFWMIVGATNTSADIIKGKVELRRQLWSTTSRRSSHRSTCRGSSGIRRFLAIVGTVLTLVVSSLAGYGFEMFRSRFRERIFAVLLLMLSIPFAAIMVPLFVMMAQAQADQHLSRRSCCRPSPRSSSSSTSARRPRPSRANCATPPRIDGLKEWQIFLYVYLPVMRSTYAAATIIVFMANWNNYLWPLIVLQTNENKTITLVISSLTSAYYPDFGVIMVGDGAGHTAHVPRLLPPPAPLRRRHAGIGQIRFPDAST